MRMIPKLIAASVAIGLPACATAPVSQPQAQPPVAAAQEEAVVIWMYQNLDGMFFQKWIKGFYFNPAHQEPAYAWIYAMSKEQ